MVRLLPEPDSTTPPGHLAEQLALRKNETDPVDRANHPGCGGKLDRQVLNLEQSHGHQLLSFGSSASRRPSPTRLKARTAIRIMRPGKVTTHHARSTH